MPYYWRRRPYRYRRYLWRRRARKIIRPRRFWRRRRRHWVRKRKLKRITIKEWQPSKINRLKIFGPYPAFEGTNLRIGHDNTQYIDSIAPYKVPGGGLFGITVFTLKGLYELHTKARNWWTKSNCNMPLIKYLGCKITFYRSLDVDYIAVYSRCGSLTATEQLYQSAQPFILTLNKNKRIITCKNKNYHRKPYKVVKIPPPSLMTNKWYFQREILDIPLCMIITAAASLDRFYQAANTISNTIGFDSLNTDLFQYHNFKQRTTTPYKPNDVSYLFTVNNRTTDWKQLKVKDIILLGNTRTMTIGTPLGEKHNVDTYFSSPNSWGNPFYPTTLSQELQPLLIYNAQNVGQLKTELNAKWEQNLQTAGFTETTKPPIINCRYNPQNDYSRNACFLANIDTDTSKWHEPETEKLVTKGLPIWLLLHGWTDWLEKSKAAQHIHTDYILGIVSDHISPPLHYYVPVDHNFLQGRSPFETDDHVKDYDRENWHPKLNFQEETIAHLVNTGPGTPKLPNNISAEGHFSYRFYFKLGGCPPPMDNVCDPQKQPTFPTPHNILSSTLLQNPEFPPEYYLYSFDQRREMLTKRAAKRIKKDKDFTETFFKPTGETSLSIKIPSPETTSTEDSEEEEESEETLQQRVQLQHRRQRKLRHRILRLLNLVQSLE